MSTGDVRAYDPGILANVLERLIVIEQGLAESRPGAELQTGVGHWVEGIERFSRAWPGETVLIGNTAVTPIDGVGRMRTLHSRLVDPTRPLHQKILTRCVMAVDPLLSKRIGPSLVRADWERYSSEELLDAVAQELSDNPNSTLLLPTPTPIIIETLISGLSILQRASGPNHPVRIRPVFSSLWHEHRGKSLNYFGIQLQRWLARGVGADIKFGIEVEGVALAYRAWAGDSVQWVPWPASVQEKVTEEQLVGAPPKVFIYASREEHGGSSLLKIVESITREIQGELNLVIRGQRSNLDEEQRIRARYPHVSCTLITESIPPKALYNLVKGSIAAVLPYDAKRYKGRGSAMAWGVLDLGVPVIAPGGTGFGDDVAQSGVGYVYGNIREIPALVQRAIREASDLKPAIARYQARRTEAVATYLGT